MSNEIEEETDDVVEEGEDRILIEDEVGSRIEIEDEARDGIVKDEAGGKIRIEEDEGRI